MTDTRVLNLAGLHRDAMALAERADLARQQGNTIEAAKRYREAFELESAAAQLLVDRFADEPSRSVLYRSAATLALDIGEFRAAERLIATALIGDPPDEIAEELRELFAQVNLAYHQQLRSNVG